MHSFKTRYFLGFVLRGTIKDFESLKSYILNFTDIRLIYQRVDVSPMRIEIGRVEKEVNDK